jgi:hypothetical protein
MIASLAKYSVIFCRFQARDCISLGWELNCLRLPVWRLKYRLAAGDIIHRFVAVMCPSSLQLICEAAIVHGIHYQFQVWYALSSSWAFILVDPYQRLPWFMDQSLHPGSWGFCGRNCWEHISALFQTLDSVTCIVGFLGIAPNLEVNQDASVTGFGKSITCIHINIVCIHHSITGSGGPEEIVMSVSVCSNFCLRYI